MKKKLRIGIIVIVLTLVGFILYSGTTRTVQEIFEENSIDFNACMDEATLIKVYVPSENIGKYDKKYAKKDRIVCMLEDQKEIDAFVDLCNKAKGQVYSTNQDEFDHDHPNLYVFEVYDDEKLLFEFRMLDWALIVGEPYTSKYYKFGENVQLFDYIHVNYDKEQYVGNDV